VASDQQDEITRQDHPKFVHTKRTWVRKFSDAFSGVALGTYGQSSFVVHGTFLGLGTLLGFYLQLEAWRWAAFLLTSGLVLGLELVNSAFESVAPAITDRHDLRIDRALKIASAAVLVAAIFSIVIGLIVFVPPIVESWNPEPAQR